MTEHEYKRLTIGDIVRHKMSADALVIIGGRWNDGFKAVRLENVRHSDEWLLFDKTTFSYPEETGR